MKMTVRACVLAAVLIVLGTGSVFGQTWTVGAPAGSVYNGAANFNLAVAREGNRELGAPVTVCASTGGVGGGAATMDTNDIFQIRYAFAGAAANDPILATTGALGAANLQVFQSAGTAAQGMTASATAAMFTPPSIGGSAPGQPQALVTVTITAGPAALGPSGINCFTVQALRFDIANTPIGATTVGPPPAGSWIIGSVVQTTEAAVVLAAPLAIPLGVSPAVNAGAAGNGALNPGMPVPSNAVGTVENTLGTAGNNTVANPTGYVTGTGTQVSGNSIAGVTTIAGFNPNSATNVVSVIPRLVQSAVSSTGAAATTIGTLSIEENAVRALTPGVTCVPACAAGATVNLPVLQGGGMFRSLVAAGPDTTTWLNAAGNTVGTQIELTLTNMPTGSSVTFPATASSAQAGAVLNLALVGSGTVAAPGGIVTYTTVLNEGASGTIGIAGSQIGPNIDIPYTVTVGSGAGTARFIVRVRPVAGSSNIPTYSELNGLSVLPSQLPVAGVVAFFDLFTVASNQSTRTYPYVTYTGGVTTQDYDTGLALSNTGKTSAVAAGVATQLNIGQDGPFTVLLISSSSTVTSIRSTATCSGGGAFPGSAANAATKYNGLTSGSLKQGDTWVALASQVTACAGVTGAWSGQVVIVTDIPTTSGFAFISQFTNLTGGATMGYVAQ